MMPDTFYIVEFLFPDRTFSRARDHQMEKVEADDQDRVFDSRIWHLRVSIVGLWQTWKKQLDL